MPKGMPTPPQNKKLDQHLLIPFSYTNAW